MRRMGRRIVNFNFSRAGSGDGLRRMGRRIGCDFHTVFHTAELQPIPWWIVWCFGILISTPFSTQRSFQPIPYGGSSWCFGIIISIPFSAQTVACVFIGSTGHGPRSAPSHRPLSAIIGQKPRGATDPGHRPLSVVIGHRPRSTTSADEDNWNYDFDPDFHTAEFSTNSLSVCLLVCLFVCSVCLSVCQSVSLVL